jgi:outer membrane receptor protein involved in Fe transport
MTTRSHFLNSRRQLGWAALLALVAVVPAVRSQTAPAVTPDAATLAKYDKNKNGVLDSDEVAALQADEKAAASKVAGKPAGGPDEVVALSPFEVNAGNDKGYYASSTMSGTRLNSKLEDLGASITVVTKQQLQDTASIDINDIFLYEANVEGIGQFTDPTTDSRGNTIDNVAGNPQGANRVRGLNAANISIGNFASSGTIPIDTYNLDSVEISRGPNSSIFGLGDASGTVNLNPSSANATRATSRVEGRIDSFGGWRTSMDVNRPLIRNKLAIRLSGVYEEKGYVRKPSIDRTERWQGSVTYRPLKSTTVKLTYETYHNYNQRPNSQPMVDAVSYWKSVGSPTWDPVTFTPYLNGVAGTPVAYKGGSDNAALPPGLYSMDTSGVRPAYIIDGGQMALYTIQQMPSNNTLPFNAALYGASNNQRYMYSGTDIQLGGGAKFGEPSLSSLFHMPVIKDKGLYDWSSVNSVAPNFGRVGSNTVRLELEQTFLNTNRQLLALQAGWFREDTNTYSRNILGQSGFSSILQVDVNQRLLDGTPNPYFLRPFVGGLEPTVSRRPVFSDDYRATLAYQLDLSHEKNILHWLGRHRFAGYGEYRPGISGSTSSHDEGVAADNPALVGMSLTNIPGANGVHVYPRYYVGDNKGQNVDYAAARVENPDVTIPMYTYDTNTTSPTAGKWVKSNVTMGELLTGGSLVKRKIRTEGVTWQSFYLNDRIVPTFGLRKDRNYSESSLGSTNFPDGSFNPVNLYNFGQRKAWNQGQTKTAGVVVKPFRWLFLSYNQADSFQPSDIQYNNLGDLLPNPTGKGKDYGVTLNLFDGKLNFVIRKYETFQLNARGTIGTIDTRARTLDVGTGGGNSFTLISKATSWANTLHGPATADPWTADQITTYVNGVLGMTPQYVDFLRTANLNDVNDAQSKGYELEMTYNPTRYWRMKFTGAQQSAIDSNMSPAAQAYIDSRLPIWTTVEDPTTPIDPATGHRTLWWNETTGGTQPQSYYIGNVLSPLKLAIATAGKRKPQTREYTFNAFSNFQFSGITENRWLRPLGIGGALRWADKAAIGYFGSAPDPDGVIRSLDKTRPIYDKALAHVDLSASYDWRFFSNKVRMHVQLNVRNFGENTHLQRIGVNPDGNYWNYRIIDPTQYILTTTFDL